MHIDTTSAWNARSMSFYAKTSSGTWEQLKFWYEEGNQDTTSKGNKDFTVSNSYVAFGFEVDIFWETDWPYSDIFWDEEDTANKGKPKEIYIALAGGSYTASVRINVNNERVFYDGNCSSNVPYGWNGISVYFTRGGGYSYKEANFYGRKSTSSPWVKLIALQSGTGNSTNHSDVTQRVQKRNTSDGQQFDYKTDYYIIPRDYVEFGFEFDVKDGTDWPYSDVFWTAANSAKTPVDRIKIDTGGAIRSASITIDVNNVTKVHVSNCARHNQNDWSYGSIKVSITDSGAFTTKYRRFWARKAGGDWEKLFSKEQGNDGGTQILSPEYVDYGFEFDITSGPDWPYSHAFWKAAEHSGCRVTEISIAVGGALWIFGDPHIDITVKGYNASGGYGTLYSYSNHDLDDYTVTGW